jgi:hypothetical protein
MANEKANGVPNPLSTATHKGIVPLETQPQNAVGSVTTTIIDIEHIPVQDDPRSWSYMRKVRKPHYYMSHYTGALRN